MSVAGLKRDDDCCIQMTAYWFVVLFSAILDMSAQGLCGMAENQSGTKKSTRTETCMHGSVGK